MTNNTNQQRKSISLSLRDKGYDETQQVYFTVETVDVSALHEVLTSHNYSPIEWVDGKRLKTNFRSACAFAADFDKGITIQEAEAILNQRGLNYALVTTKSHTPEAHRFRVIIPFSHRIHQHSVYERVAEAIDGLFDRRCDQSVFDGARFLYGSPEDAYYSECWTGHDFDVSPFIGIDLKGVKYGVGDWGNNLVVRLAYGEEQAAAEITSKERIFCPFHEDGTASAFIDRSENSGNWYIYCSACSKTFWKVREKPNFAGHKWPYWSHSSKIYEIGLTNDHFFFKEIGVNKFFTMIGVSSPDGRKAAYEHLIRSSPFLCVKWSKGQAAFRYEM